MLSRILGRTFLCLLVGVVVLWLASWIAFPGINSRDNKEVGVGFGILVLLVVLVLGILGAILKGGRKMNGKGKQLLIVAVLAGTFLYTTGCTVVTPGHVGIEVHQAGKDRGVQDFPPSTGWVFYNPVTTTVFQYPTFVQTAVWTHSLTEGNPVNEEVTFTTGDQMKVDADISLAYHLVAEKVPAFYVKFRSDDLKTFTHGFLRNLAREKFDNIAGKYKIEQIMGDNAPFLSETRAVLQKELDSFGVQLDQFGFIGAPRPPPTVTASINAKVTATQDAIKVENELRTARAQAEKVVAEANGRARAMISFAEGQAKANQIVASSVNATILEWKRLGIQESAIQKWNGQLPTYTGGGALPMIQMPKQ